MSLSVGVFCDTAIVARKLFCKKLPLQPIVEIKYK